MKKVFYSVQAAEDLEDIFCGLALWEKHPMELTHVAAYVSDIRKACDSLGKSAVRRKCTYKLHQQYGTCVLSYRRTSSTVWYIIYNIDEEENIRIEKIINNYMTTE
jgi:plasmid stabilization system protein ParE